MADAGGTGGARRDLAARTVPIPATFSRIGTDGSAGPGRHRMIDVAITRDVERGDATVDVLHFMGAPSGEEVVDLDASLRARAFDSIDDQERRIVVNPGARAGGERCEVRLADVAAFIAADDRRVARGRPSFAEEVGRDPATPDAGAFDREALEAALESPLVGGRTVVEALRERPNLIPGSMTDLGYDSAAQAGFAKRYALLDIEERIAVAAQLTGRGGGGGARLVDEAYAAMCRDGALRLADVAPGARLDGRLADVVLRPGDEAGCLVLHRRAPGPGEGPGGTFVAAARFHGPRGGTHAGILDLAVDATATAADAWPARRPGAAMQAAPRGTGIGDVVVVVDRRDGARAYERGAAGWTTLGHVPRFEVEPGFERPSPPAPAVAAPGPLPADVAAALGRLVATRDAEGRVGVWVGRGDLDGTSADAMGRLLAKHPETVRQPLMDVDPATGRQARNGREATGREGMSALAATFGENSRKRRLYLDGAGLEAAVAADPAGTGALVRDAAAIHDSRSEIKGPAAERPKTAAKAKGRGGASAER